MNVLQLRDYLDQLITAGHGDLPACIGEQDAVSSFVTVVEINEAELVSGRFEEDPAPKMPGLNTSTGAVILLTGWTQDLLGDLDTQGFEIGDLPDTPVKIRATAPRMEVGETYRPGDPEYDALNLRTKPDTITIVGIASAADGVDPRGGAVVQRTIQQWRQTAAVRLKTPLTPEGEAAAIQALRDAQPVVIDGCVLGLIEIGNQDWQIDGANQCGYRVDYFGSFTDPGPTMDEAALRDAIAWVVRQRTKPDCRDETEAIDCNGLCQQWADRSHQAEI